jgi:hypothetical protein
VAGVASGIVYAVICVVAIEIIIGAGTGSTGNAKKTAGGVLGWPADQWLVGIAGVVLSVFGLLARMVVFGLVGIFLIKAAVDYSAKQAVGLDGALPKLAAQSDGPALPGVVAAGLVSFAVFSICDARYRKI